MTSKSRQRLFSESDVEKLLRVFATTALMTRESSEAAVHALVDIQESLTAVYQKLIPALLSAASSSKAVDKELLWDIREELRHIDYHIHDSGILDL